MLIQVPRPWKIDEREATPEHIYWNRRAFLKSAGILAVSILAGCKEPGQGPVIAAEGKGKDPTLDLYPAKRNSAFTLDRSLTNEEEAGRYNNYYEFTDQKDVYKYVGGFKIRPWTVTVTGLIKKPKTYEIDELIRAMRLEERLYRHRCVEAWSMAVPWTGFLFSDLIRLVEPASNAKYVRMVSFNKPEEAPGQKKYRWYPFPYYEGLTIAEAMNELTFLVTGIYGHPLPVQHGAPLRLAVPWKYGYKSIKGIVHIEFLDHQPRTFWNDLAPSEYDFTSNVNPDIPHPRWSQASERLLGVPGRRPTLPYNGYEKFAAHLYQT